MTVRTRTQGTDRGDSKFNYAFYLVNGATLEIEEYAEEEEHAEEDGHGEEEEQAEEAGHGEEEEHAEGAGHGASDLDLVFGNTPDDNDNKAFGGRIGFLPGLASNQVRLPELASQAAGLLGRGIAGRTLEILRPTGIPEPISLAANILEGPVAAISGANGRSAFVLDEGPAGWRVRELDLSTGEVVRVFASGDGAPSRAAAA